MDRPWRYSPNGYLTADEHRTIRSLHPGIINIRPLIRSEETEVLAPVSREGRKTDELFRDYYRYRMGVDIPDELMEAFLELLNDDSERDDADNANDKTRDNDAKTGTVENAGDQIAKARWIGQVRGRWIDET